MDLTEFYETVKDSLIAFGEPIREVTIDTREYPTLEHPQPCLKIRYYEDDIDGCFWTTVFQLRFYQGEARWYAVSRHSKSLPVVEDGLEGKPYTGWYRDVSNLLYTTEGEVSYEGQMYIVTTPQSTKPSRLGALCDLLERWGVPFEKELDTSLVTRLCVTLPEHTSSCVLEVPRNGASKIRLSCSLPDYVEHPEELERALARVRAYKALYERVLRSLE